MFSVKDPVPAYDTTAIEIWARRDLGVRDAHMIAQILKIYTAWYNTRKYTVEQATQSIPGQADIAMGLDYKGTEKYTVVVANWDPRIFVRRDDVAGGPMRRMSVLERASYMLKPGFEDSKQAKSGQYIQGRHLYDSFWHKRWASITRDIQEKSYEDFVTRVGTLLGDIDPEKNRSWGISWRFTSRSDLYKKIQPHIHLVERQKMRIALRHFISLLDQDALKAMWKARYLNEIAYTWLTGRQPEEERIYYKDRVPELRRASPEAQKRRQAAIQALPSLVHAMTNYGWEMNVFSAALDNGSSLKESVEAILANQPAYEQYDRPVLTKEMMGWLHGKNYRFVDGYKAEDDVRIGGFIDDITRLQVVPPEWRPSTPENIRVYGTVSYVVGGYAQLTGRAKGALLREFMSVMRQPKGLPAGIVEPEGNEELYGRLHKVSEKIRLDNTEMSDFINRAGDQIVLPEIMRMASAMGVEDRDLWGQQYPEGDRVMRQSLSCLFGGMSVVKIASLSMRWHKHMARLDERTKTYNTEDEWLPLFPPMTLPNGVRASCLVSNEALRDEGHNMGHCVSGYTHRCVLGRSHIVSLKAKDGSWSTTLELQESNENPDRKIVEVIQHKGPGNEIVTHPDALKAAEMVVAHVAKFPPDWDAMKTMRNAHMVNKALIRIGFDPMDDKACEDAYSAWQGTFRDVFPDPSRSGFLVRSGLTERLKTVLSGYTPF